MKKLLLIILLLITGELIAQPLTYTWQLGRGVTAVAMAYKTRINGRDTILVTDSTQGYYVPVRLVGGATLTASIDSTSSRYYQWIKNDSIKVYLDKLVNARITNDSMKVWLEKAIRIDTIGSSTVTIRNDSNTLSRKQVYATVNNFPTTQTIAGSVSLSGGTTGISDGKLDSIGAIRLATTHGNSGANCVASATALASHNCRYVVITIDYSTTGTIYIGSSGVNTSTGTPLRAGDSITIYTTNTNTVYHISDGSTQANGIRYYWEY